MKEILQRERARTPRRRFGLYAYLVILLAVASVGLAFWLLFYIQKVEVKGNVYSDGQDVVRCMIEDEWSFNSLYTLIKYQCLDGKVPANVKSVNVTLSNPWTIGVEVQDKQPVGGMKVGERYIYCDETGLIIFETDELLETVPLIQGIEVTEAKLHQELSVKDGEAFLDVLEVMKMIDEREMTPDEIRYQSKGSAGVVLVYGDITIQLGNEHFQIRLAQVESMLKELTGEKGTLHLEKYTESNTTSSFKRKN